MNAATATTSVLSPLVRDMIERYPDEVARLAEASPLEEAADLMAKLSPSDSHRILNRLTPDLTVRLLDALETAVARRLIEGIDPHRAAALLARMSAESRERQLASLDADLAEEIRALAAYPPDSAGGLMDACATAFGPHATVREVVRRLRGLEGRRVQDVFIIDADGRLQGAVPIQDVVLASPDQRLDSLVQGPPRRVEALAHRDEVISVLQSHRGASLPVVDFDGRLLGVLRQNELLATVEQEATADIVTMVGGSKQERALSSPLMAVRFRHPWLQINLLTAFLAASVVGLFEQTIAQFTALAVLLPVVAGQSGNTGAQALAVTMRGLALREVRLRHWLRVAGKELTAGALNGVFVALTTSLGVYIWSRSPGLALVIAISMVLSMMIAGLAGAVIPMLLTAVRQDPAQSSSVILTTVTDIAGFFSFLGIATMLSSML